jgi:hypothetical protein
MKWFIFEAPDWGKDYRLLTTSSSDEAGERLVTVTSRGITKRGGVPWRGTYVFYRDRAWALKEFSYGHANPTTPDHYVQKGRYQYEGMHEGVPLLKGVEYWRECGPERRRVIVERFEVTRIEPGPVPEEEFSLTLLPLEGAGRSGRWVRLMLGLLGGVFVVTSFLVFRQGGRRKAIRALGRSDVD